MLNIIFYEVQMKKLLFALCVVFAGIHITAADKNADQSKLSTPKKGVKDSHLSSPGKADNYSPYTNAKSRGERKFNAKKNTKHPQLPSAAYRKLGY